MENFESIYNAVWEKLELGARPEGSDYHIPTIATVEDGRPHPRSVVMRSADRANRVIGFHTDARSPKVRRLQKNPSVGWHFYSRADKTQICLQTIATVHVNDELTNGIFTEMPARCKRVYLAPNPPSKEHDQFVTNVAPGLEDRMPTDEEAEAGRKNFAVVRCEVVEIDWLYLLFEGHRRARFQWNGTKFDSCWLSP